MSSDSLFQAVERFGQALEGSGMPRMPARVFAYVLAEDSDRYTAAQLAEGLQVSPAAISGAVRYLVDTGLLIRERAPGVEVTSSGCSTGTSGPRSPRRASR